MRWWGYTIRATQPIQKPQEPLRAIKHLARPARLLAAGAIRSHHLQASVIVARCYFFTMSIRAKVSSGRIIADEPTLLPEGTTLNLVVHDEDGDLDDEEREALNAHLLAGWKGAQAGNFRPASELLTELRSKHR